MITSRGRGDFIPGFDCTTGEAVGYTWSEWQERCRGLRVEQRTESILVFDEHGLRYEIYHVPGQAIPNSQ